MIRALAPVTNRTFFWVVVLALVVPAFLVERHLEGAGLVDVLGLWYTVYCVLAFSMLVAAAMTLLRKFIRRHR